MMSENLACQGEERHLLGALVTAIEAHPKRPLMYRVALKLEAAGSEVGDTAESEEEEAEAGDALLTVHEDTLVAWRLLKGRRLSAADYELLKREEQLEEAYRSALFMLERKARTTTELSRALKRKGYASDVASACLERLNKRGMLDDAAYAKRFTEQRAVSQRKGRRLIKQELLQRGVSRTDAEQAIGELDGQVERDAALALASKRWPNIKGNTRERKQKLMAMLLRRGFPSSVAREAAEHAVAQSGEQNPDFEFGDAIEFDDRYE